MASVVKFLELVALSELKYCDDPILKMAIQKAFKLGVQPGDISKLKDLTMGLFKSQTITSNELALPFLNLLTLDELQ